MRASHRLSLISALAALSTCQAVAQTLPWPTDAPRAGGGAGAPAAPMPMPGGAAPMGGGGFMAPPQPFGAADPPCMANFLKMREDVEKKGRTAKAISERKPSREEMCKQVTLVAAAEAKWLKFTEANVAGCGIPREVAQQLKVMHGHTEQARENICAAGPAAAPPAPSLSDALGTARLPMPEATKSGGGSTLDTLTGNVLQR